MNTHSPLMSLEVPAVHLNAVHPLIDFHFVIATELLRNPEYSSWYKAHAKRSDKKYTLLDNGAYEEGFPIGAPELAKVAIEHEVDGVFAPDWLNDAKRTIHEYLCFARHLHRSAKKPIDIGFIPQGRSPVEVVDCLEEALHSTSNIAIIGLSFLNDRPAVAELLERRGIPERHPDLWWHYLGLYHYAEVWSIPAWVRSYDTVKPLKAAFHCLKVEDLPRGLGKWNSSWKINCPELIHYNIARMRAR